MSALAVVLVAGIGFNGQADELSAGSRSRIRVNADVSPRTQLFGDTLTARFELVADTRRVELGSVRVDGRFGPYSPVAEPVLERRRVGGAELVVWSVKLRCLDPACRPGNAAKRVTFTPARVVYSLGRGGRVVARSVVVDWPTLLVYSRVDQVEVAAVNPLTQPPWRADLGSLPRVSYSAPPGLLSGLLYAVGGLLIAGALLLCVPLALRDVRASAEAGQAGVPQPPLEQALVLLERNSEGDGAVEPRRQALELVAAELGRRDERELELSARRLAWSEEPPPYEDTRALARSARRVTDGGSSGNGG